MSTSYHNNPCAVIARERKAARAALPPHKKPADRKCLGCGQTFRSSWIGNRLCESCGGSPRKLEVRP